MTKAIVIIGAGQCGGTAALALRDKGYAGSVTLIGDEDLAPYERPPLSKRTLLDEPEPKWLVDRDRYREAGIDLVTGAKVSRIERGSKTVVTAGGREFSYDKLLLATGAKARALPGLPAMERLLTLRDHADATKIRDVLGEGKRLIVIGGGFIGLELAATARQSGTAVTVIEGLSRLMARAVPQEIAAIAEARHRAAGIELLFGVGVAGVAENRREISVTLADGRTLNADFVIVGIGALPNTDLAEQAGLTVDNGIAVDGQLRTSDPDIYAAGDCCSFPLALYDGRRVRLESWRSAMNQGRLAVENMLGAALDVEEVPWFWSDQHDLSLQIAGLSDGAETVIRRDLSEDAFILFHLDADGRLLAAGGIGPGNSVARDIRLAEMLIARRSKPDPEALASPTVKLKSLLTA